MSFRIRFIPILLVCLVVATPGLARAQATMPHDSPANAEASLDLVWLERTVIERNPSLAALRAAWREAEARGSRESSRLAPRLGAALAPRSFARGGPESAWRVEFEQPLRRPGQGASLRRAAAADADAARHELERARLDLVAEARRTFYDDYHARRRAVVALELSQLVAAMRKVALARYSAGQVGQYEVLQADAEISMLEHEAVAADRDHKVATARLLALLHFDPAQRLPATPDTLPVPDFARYQAMLGVRDSVTWPELAAADAAVTAARARSSWARAERLPMPSIGVGYDRFAMADEWRAMVMASIDLPFLSGQAGAAQREARAALEAAEARRESVRDEIERTLAERRTRLIESLHELDILRGQTVPATERAMVSLRAGYEAGRVGFGDVMASLRAVLDARFDYHRVLAAANLDAAELERALGGPRLPPVRKDEP